VIEAVAEPVHLAVQFPFAGVREGRVANVMHQGQRFRKIFVKAEHRSGGPRNLRNLNGVRQAVAEVIGKSRRENLGLGFQAAKGARMNDTIAIALEDIAVRVLRFRITAAGAALYREAKAL
jgi:hypothetical protein